MKYNQLSDPGTANAKSNVVLPVKMGDSMLQSRTQCSFNGKCIFFQFTVKGRRIAFESNEEREKNASAAHHLNKEDEFKEVFCDKRIFFFGPIKLVNSILSFGSWISVLQKDITGNIKCHVKMTE